MNMKLSCKEIQQVVRDAVIEKLMLDPILFRFRYGNRLPFYGHRYLGEHFESADHVIQTAFCAEIFQYCSTFLDNKKSMSFDDWLYFIFRFFYV